MIFINRPAKSPAITLATILILFCASVFAQQKGTFADPRDGKVYKTVKIGTQTWFAENLNYEAEGSVCYENNPDNCAKYGRLYNWETAMKVCPKGWHLPSNDEWNVLVEFAGGEGVAGDKLKTKSGWREDNGTDELSFSALPGGIGFLGDYGLIGYYGYWWSAFSKYSCYYAYWHGMTYSEEGAAEEDFEPYFLRSVRCLQD